MLLLFKGGKVVDQRVGAMGKAMPEEARAMAGPLIGMIGKAGGAMFGSQVGGEAMPRSSKRTCARYLSSRRSTMVRSSLTRANCLSSASTSVHGAWQIAATGLPAAAGGKVPEELYALFPVLKEKRLLAAGMLSGGQQQMLAMARALMGHPKLLLLDEPSMGLAPLLIREIFRIVESLRDEGITIFLVEQNAHAALAIADIGYVIETGAIVLSGPGPELLDNEQVQSAYLGM